MRVTLLLCVFAAALVGCGAGDYGDAGADRPSQPIRTINVDNTGNAACPGELLAPASEGRAFCTRPPQSCSLTSAPPNRIRCVCTGMDGGMGTWACTFQQP